MNIRKYEPPILKSVLPGHRVKLIKGSGPMTVEKFNEITGEVTCLLIANGSLKIEVFHLSKLMANSPGSICSPSYAASTNTPGFDANGW